MLSILIKKIERSDTTSFQALNLQYSIWFWLTQRRKARKTNNYINLLKKLCVFAPLREIFSVPVYPGKEVIENFKSTPGRTLTKFI
jgi:hypothetical protein